MSGYPRYELEMELQERRDCQPFAGKIRGWFATLVYINFMLCANLLAVATHAGHEELVMVEVRHTAVLTRVLRVLIIALLCVGVFLQILGAAVAFWAVDGSDDPFMSSILTSFAVLGNESV